MNNENAVEITRKSIILAKPGIILNEEEDHWGLLYNPDIDYSFSINPVSVFIWKELKNKQTVLELIDKVKRNFQGVPGEVEDDIIQFLNMLLENKLAEPETSKRKYKPTRAASGTF